MGRAATLGFSTGRSGAALFCGARGSLGPEDGGRAMVLGSSWLSWKPCGPGGGGGQWGEPRAGPPGQGQPDRNEKQEAGGHRISAGTDSRSEGSTCAQQAWGCQSCLAHGRTRPASPRRPRPPQHPITDAGERGLRRKGTVPDLLCLSPISMESVSQRPKPRETHAVPTASTVFCSPLTSDLESKRQGRPCPPHPHGPAPSAPSTNSQGKALAGNIQMSVYFLNRGASLLSLHALGPVAGR